MRMPLAWTPALKTDVAEIDEQHQELFRRIDMFTSSISAGNAPAEVKKMVEFMESYAEMHLTSEEKMLDAAGFPQLAVHKSHHDYFRRNIAEIKRQLETGTPEAALVGKIHQTITLWLISHIKNMDLAWAAYIKTRNQ